MANLFILGILNMSECSYTQDSVDVFNVYCFVLQCRYVGVSWPGPDATQVSVRAHGSRVGERGTEAQVEVAADPAEQRGLL